jgi:hypothetical protein
LTVARTRRRLGIAVAALAAASAGPPYRTDDPVPVDLGHWEIDAFSQATRASGDTAGVLPGIEVNYGAAPDLQLHVIAPVAFDRPAGGTANFGPGDAEFGVKYRFLDAGVAAGVFPTVDVPTGDAERGLGSGHADIFLPLWLEKGFGPWLSDAGGGYWINPGGGNRNYWFVGWLLQRQVTQRLALGGEIFHQTAAVDGGADTTAFNLGLVYDITEHDHVLLSAGRGIVNPSRTDAFSYYLAMQWTF